VIRLWDETPDEPSLRPVPLGQRLQEAW